MISAKDSDYNYSQIFQEIFINLIRLCFLAKLSTFKIEFLTFTKWWDFSFKEFFQYFNAPLHFVEGVRLHEYNTFPSGHTTLAFSFFFLLSVFFQKPWLSAVFFVLALLVAYSRMYLSMHFLADVWVGSILGISIATGVYQLVTHHRWFTSKRWWDGKWRMWGIGGRFNTLLRDLFLSYWSKEIVLFYGKTSH